MRPRTGPGAGAGRLPPPAGGRAGAGRGGRALGRPLRCAAPAGHGGGQSGPAARPPRRGGAMLALGCASESGSFSNLFEAGTGVNAPADAFGQSPAHLAACGGEAFFLLWQLQTGANLNQQDCFGEAPIHKAAKAGSLECLALLVAGDAKIDLCNNSGQTAADLALAYGFLECAKFLTIIQHTQTMKQRGQSGYPRGDRHGLPRENPAAQKQENQTSRSISRKRRRSGDSMRSLRPWDTTVMTSHNR
ncbi:ankyrin repeat domain-containing protein 37 isoform X3 [Falco biarmicus]|uniref:ankyrin repeat domain-containing protein 37 isoform X4 n=1 Tax=Falco cherrug TaxID=345164 RepID=UPI0024790C34|nr:ankyrin repeat domain-containing protein 37 isoform X4 [Falco cherrug]XP_055651497.1 ankyrin repeat domain-containing protein 37 isoform X3 [Falco peregrinus]XP_056182121.1 ankyrin repeat domain-containing protein 37 isoform X3 [Falco biarmicus]